MKKFLSLFAAMIFAASMMATESLKATLDFTDNTVWQIPSDAKAVDAATFTDGTYQITLQGTTGNGYRWYANNGNPYLLNGKQGATFTLPAFTWKTTKIKVVGTSGASESVKQNIFVGDVAVSTETTGAKNVTNEYAIAEDYQAAGNVYVLKVTSNHNTQLTKIEIYGEDATPEPVGEAHYYVTGTMTSWAANEAYELVANPEVEGEYMGEFTFAADDAFKVIMDNGSASYTWYPDGETPNYTINQAGDYAIYFRPDGQGGEGWYYGFFYVIMKEEPISPIDHTYFATGNDWAADTESSAVWDPETGKITVTLAQPKVAAWQGQVFINTVHAEEGKCYNFSVKMKANKAMTGVTIKWQENNNDPIMVSEVNTISLAANEEFVYSKEQIAGVVGNGQLVYDFGFAEAGTVVEIYDLVIEETACPEPPTPGEAHYYLVGNMTEWAVVADEAHEFLQNIGAEGEEYSLGFTLAEGNEFKVVKVQEGVQENVWFPAEAGNYVVDAAHAGEKTIYFRPNYDGGDDWYAGCIFVEANPIPPQPAEVVIYDWAGQVGTTILGVSSVETSTVKIHTNSDQVDAIKFSSSYVYTDGKWIAIKPAEGGFKAGDVLSVAVCFNNADDTKMARIKAYGANGTDSLFCTTNGINGRTSAADPAVETFTLEADQDSLFLGRYGNTATYVTMLKVERAATPEPVGEAHYYLVGNMTEWAVVADAEHEFLQNINEEGVYTLAFNLVEGNEFKVVKVQGGVQDNVWYPAEAGNFVVDAAHAGEKIIFFRPDYQGGEGWYAGCIYVEAEEPACNWAELPFVEGPAEYANQFKVCKADGEHPSVVNIQQPDFATEIGIYMTFPSAAFGEISLPEGAYDVQGAGIIFHVSAFTEEYTEVTVVVDNNPIVFTVYNAAATPVVVHTYTVAGSSDVAFGTAWAPSNADNDMALEDGIYTWARTELTLAAGTIEFKVCEDHAWTHAWPAQNYQLAIPEAGIYTITITFNAETKEVAAEAVKTGEAVVVPSIAMHGNFLGSWADTENFTVAEGNETASLTLTIAEGNYEFGMRIGGSGNWTANGVQFTRENNAAEVVAGQGNLKLAADVAGEYTFMWIYASNTLVITYPEIVPVNPIDHTYFATGASWDADTESSAVWDPETGKITVTLVQPKVAAWQGQVFLNTVKAEPGKCYNFSVKMKANKAMNGVTIKWQENNNDPIMVSEINTISLAANEEFVYVKNQIAGQDGNGQLVYDFGFAEAGTVVEIYDLVIEETACPVADVHYYLVGTMTEWAVVADEAHEFLQNIDALGEEYTLTFTLAAADEFKVVKVEGETQTWIPDGMDNNYVVDADHAGQKVIYFRPNYDGGEGWHAGCIYVEKNSGEGVNNVEAAVKAVKMLRDGQVVIVRGEHIYTIMGQMVK